MSMFEIRRNLRSYNVSLNIGNTEAIDAPEIVGLVVLHLILRFLRVRFSLGEDAENRTYDTGFSSLQGHIGRRYSRCMVFSRSCWIISTGFVDF